MKNQSLPIEKRPVNNDSEIAYLLHLAAILGKNRKKLLKTMAWFVALGLLLALLTPAEYTAKTTLVPQTDQPDNTLSGISSLAAMAGYTIDAGQSANVFSPLVYPEIVNSTPFQLELMNTGFNFSGIEGPISLYDYYTTIHEKKFLAKLKKYTIGLPGVVFSTLGSTRSDSNESEKNMIILSTAQERVRKLVEQKVSLSLDSKQGTLTLSASFPEPFVAAQVAEYARALLQKYITGYKISKASTQLSFINERYEEKKTEFEKAQERLARFRDQNRNVSSALVRTEEERLQGEAEIARNVYNELARQLEEAKIKVKEDTPVFSVIEPVVVPTEKSRPKVLLIVAISIFAGLIAGIGLVFVGNFVERKEEIQTWEKNEAVK